MTHPIISVCGLSKAYRIGLKEQIPDTLAGAITGLAKAPLRKYRQLKRLNTFGENGNGSADTLWALRDVSFEVPEGQVLGIIGRNGAGKSTLLKILSRITEPTSGRAVIHGRVSSLLEVGTGFHPELTGRENVFLNGTVLGMTKREIDRKFDEIVDFSGVEKFLDTPIKRYSSGMTVRLAFAVAAHLEPEILIVDEVLAVGDAEFQKKCMGKMQDVAQGGRTVLFVSHNMGAVQSLCDRGLVLRNGKVICEDNAAKAIQVYLQAYQSAPRNRFEANNPDRSGNGRARLTNAYAEDCSGQATSELTAGRDAALVFEYDNPSQVPQGRLAATIYNDLGVAVTTVDMGLTNFGPCTLERRGGFRCSIPTLPLPVGGYRIAVAFVVDEEVADVIPNAIAFQVHNSVYFGTGKTPQKGYCTCLIDHHWEDTQSRTAPCGAAEANNGVGL